MNFRKAFLDWRKRSTTEKFPATFTGVVIVLSIAALVLDVWLRDGNYWFQRSGALLTLAGVELQFAKLISVWRMQLGGVLSRDPVASRLASGQGVGLLETAKEAEEARTLAQSLLSIVTGKSISNTWAVALIVVGTLVWAFADLPFKA